MRNFEATLHIESDPVSVVQPNLGPRLPPNPTGVVPTTSELRSRRPERALTYDPDLVRTPTRRGIPGPQTRASGKTLGSLWARD